MTHTATPWFLNYIDILATDDPFDVLAICENAYDDNAEANAAFIVRACNAHDDLVEALTRLRNECDLEGLRNRAGFDYWLNLADLAIAKATA